tara:strand:+ start:263 stop:544 length:282 start_codon:yes stop_codon:yes gene_type:complete
MNKENIIKNLIRLADHLDGKKLESEANFVDNVIQKVSTSHEDVDLETEVGSLRARVDRLTRLLEGDKENDCLGPEMVGDADDTINYLRDMEHD